MTVAIVSFPDSASWMARCPAAQKKANTNQHSQKHEKSEAKKFGPNNERDRIVMGHVVVRYGLAVAAPNLFLGPIGHDLGLVQSVAWKLDTGPEMAHHSKSAVTVDIPQAAHH